MKRALLALALLSLAGLAGFAALRRPSRRLPIEGDPLPFQAAPQGRGIRIEYRAGDIPIRMLAWSRPLPGGATVVQVASQSGRQQAFLFVDGRLAATLDLHRPDGVSATAFDFAELEDAAWQPGQRLFLLYRLRQAGGPGLLVAWDLVRQAQAWSCPCTASRLALSGRGKTLFLFGAPGTIQTVAASSTPPSVADPIDLPPGMGAVTDLLPLGGGDFLAAHAGGLGVFRQGSWSLQAAPPSAPLGFAPGQGTLARTADRLWWQPEPGRLLEVDAEGRLRSEPDLAALLSGPRAQDHALLRLLGADPRGSLWFGLEAPTFRTAPTTAPPPALPAPVPEAASVPEPIPAPATPAPSLEEIWRPYLQAGLARIYRWTPGSARMELFDWANLWPSLGAPSDVPCPEDGGNLAPAGGGCLLGDPARRWWLPLAALEGPQPR